MAPDPDETPAAPDEQPDPADVIAAAAGVGAEYVDPEPDEDSTDANAGDLVQLVRTGWVRFVIGGHGRVRFRPPRFGELRHMMFAYEEMIDGVQERSHTVQALAENLNAEVDAMARAAEAAKAAGKDSPSTPEQRHELLTSVTLRSRKAGRELTAWREDQYIQWWLMVHGGDGEKFHGLGVSGEQMPEHDALPVWLTVPALASAVLQHWQAVPLDRGRR